MFSLTDNLDDKTVLILDIETTGLNKIYAEVLQVAILEYTEDINNWKLHNWYYTPGGYGVPKIITELTGLTKTFLEDRSCGLTFEEAHSGLENYLKQVQDVNNNIVIVGHNITQFDFPVLQTKFANFGRKLPIFENQIYDTLKDRSEIQGILKKDNRLISKDALYKKIWPGYTGKEEKYAESILNTLNPTGSNRESQSHNAMYDVVVTGLTLKFARQRYSELHPKVR